MYSLNINELKMKMNSCGASKTPFLFAVDFDISQGVFVSNPLDQSDILFHTPLGGNIPLQSSTSAPEASLTAHPISYEEYKHKFDIVMAGLRRGDSFLTNLTIKTPVDTSLSLKQILLASTSPYRFLLPDNFVCFSPERFMKITDSTISTNPMKGTINADVPNAAAVILADEKETEEHYTIVDLLRNDLGMVADNIAVDRFRYIDRISTSNNDILQVSSEISGSLSSDYLSYIGDIIFKMLPAGSISGAPKKSTINIIHKAEGESRNFYSGVFGYFDGNKLDSAVIIRYIEQRDNHKYFRSGGGITINSDPVKEYDEVLAKIYLPFI